MRKILLNPILVPAIAAAVIFAVIFHGKHYERAALSYFLRGLVPMPHIIEEGSAEDGIAWQVRTISDRARDGEPLVPGVVLLEDDPEGVFQSSPHAPIDLALIARNMKQVGGDTLGIGSVMAWEAPDTIDLAALDRVLEDFQSVITTVPLARGATAESMPHAFRRASVPLDSVKGDAGALATVNRKAIPDALLGGENSLAGFTYIDGAGDDGQPHLLAKWEDRVVFAFPLLAALTQAGLELDALEIRPGSHIRVGNGGWVIPIDNSGRMKSRLAPAPDWAEIPAERMLDADSLEGMPAPDMWLIRDGRSFIDGALRAQSAELSPLLRTLALGAALTEPRELKTIPRIHGWILLGAVTLLLGTITRYGPAAMQIGLVFTFVGLVALQWAALWVAWLWMPAMPAILAANVVWAMALPIILAKRRKAASATA